MLGREADASNMSFSMTSKHTLRDSFRNPIVTVVGALLLTALGAGVIVLVLLFVVEPLWRPQLRESVAYRSEAFTLWYQKDSPAKGGHAELARALEEDLDDLTRLLEVNRSQIPPQIGVFIHNDMQAMKGAILERKGGQAVPTYRPALDLLASEVPRPRLAELVLAFGWGRCGSQLLQIGAALYAAEPTRNYHAFVAALPERLFLTLHELIRLEETNRLPQSLYQRVDSPYAPAAIGDLADLKSLLGLSVEEMDPSDLTFWEAASFVQFLVEEKGGIAGLKGAWGAGKTTTLLERIAPLVELGDAWRATALEEGRTSPDLPYLRAFYLVGSGDPDAAFAETRRWSLEGLSDEGLLLAGRCACAVGAFAEARAILERLPRGEAKDELERLTALYSGWGVVERGRIRVLSADPSATTLEKLLASVEESYASITRRLALSPIELPGRLTVLIYQDEATRGQGRTLVPFAEAQSATLHLVATEEVAFRLAQVLPAYAWVSETYSRLLREGLAAALARGAGLLVEEGCRLLREGRWLPLRSVDFGSAEASVVWTEAGLLLEYLLEHYGSERVRTIWIATSPLDRYLSFDRALEEICGTSRQGLEGVLFASFLDCAIDTTECPALLCFPVTKSKGSPLGQMGIGGNGADDEMGVIGNALARR